MLKYNDDNPIFLLLRTLNL